MNQRGKIFDDLSQLMTNAMGVAQGAKDEANTAMKSMMDRWMADRDFVNDLTTKPNFANGSNEDPKHFHAQTSTPRNSKSNSRF